MDNSFKEKIVQEKAYENYKNSNPWPSDDDWHEATHSVIENFVNRWIKKYITEESICLNIGSGKTKYKTKGKLIQMDIIEEYIHDEPNYIVGSLENIPFEDESIDFIVCVGSVLNYCDAMRSISEISRTLRSNGRAIIEFERSNSAEFLFNKNYGNTVFLNKYHYNNQEHSLWMYSEKYIKSLLEFYNLKIESIYRFHILSSLMYRLGLDEKKASKYSKFDASLQSFSYPISHNIIIAIIK